jgi:hypothetical protein
MRQVRLWKYRTDALRDAARVEIERLNVASCRALARHVELDLLHIRLRHVSREQV